MKINRLIIYGTLCYVVSIVSYFVVPLLWEHVFEFDRRAHVLLRVIVAASWIFFALLTYFEAKKNQRPYLWALASGLLNFADEIKSIVVQLIWAVGGFR